MLTAKPRRSRCTGRTRQSGRPSLCRQTVNTPIIRRLNLAEQACHVVCLTEVVLYIIVLRLIVEFLERAALFEEAVHFTPYFHIFTYGEESCFQQ